MECFKIYLAGGMIGLNFEEQNTYRKYIKNILESYECNYRVKVCNPVDYYNYKTSSHESEREVMEFDLHKVRTSDLIIANFNAPKSLGTMAEIAIAYDRRIPVIGLNENGYELYPWQLEMCNRIFTSIDKMLDYVEDYYLN